MLLCAKPAAGCSATSFVQGMVVWLGIGFSTTEKPAHASAVHDHIIVAASHLADGADVHAPVWAGYKRDLESLCIHKVP